MNEQGDEYRLESCDSTRPVHESRLEYYETRTRDASSTVTGSNSGGTP